MPPVKKAKEITVDVSQPVSNDVGGARQQGHVMVCDFDFTSDPGAMAWKPFMDLNIEVGVLKADGNKVLVFARRRILGDEVS